MISCAIWQGATMPCQMVNLYVVEGTYRDSDAVMTLIPAQAWEDVQGDDWRGAESQYVEDVPSHFQEGPAGKDE